MVHEDLLVDGTAVDLGDPRKPNNMPSVVGNAKATGIQVVRLYECIDETRTGIWRAV